MADKSPPGLNVELALQLLQPNGLLSQNLPGFEARTAQQEMMKSILQAYNHSTISLIEAGTGTGKSIAYLIPALLWAVQNKERTVISTNTITLQEQLIHKDIPLLTKAMKLEVKSVLVKGMSNYLCLRKLEDTRQELRYLEPAEVQEFERIDAWKNHTLDGSRADLPFLPSAEAWERVCAENDTCSNRKCVFYDKCHFFKARKQAADAQILVVNHHMLFADLSVRGEDNNYQNPSVLPPYSRIILDEAHNIEDIATDYFAARVSHLSLLRNLSKLLSEKQGKLTVLKEKMVEYFKRKRPSGITSIFNRFEIDLPGMRNDISTLLGSTFQGYQEFSDALNPNPKGDEGQKGENKLRVLNTHHSHSRWNSLVADSKRLIDGIEHLTVSLNGLERDLTFLKDERFDELTQGIRFEINAIASRLSSSCAIISQFFSDTPSTSIVRWIEAQRMRTMTNMHLVNADLDIAKRLVDNLFSKFPTIILTSATLSTNRKFDFIRRRLGLVGEFAKQRHPIIEQIYDSPFDFQKQALFAIPNDIPNPMHPDYILTASEKIWQIIQASRGNAFVLFTSYSMLKTCHQLIGKRLVDNRYVVLKQGEENRQALLNRFRATDRSVLFGTDSFWEGVDVVGDALRCVIITKLPFKVPSEPMIQARTEAILAEGGDPFLEYSLPNAIVKFKQGFGRLIRNKRDRGCVVCLDSRILNKGYGRQFLNSLPECQQIFTDTSSIQQQMSDFYRRTHHLVKSSNS